MSTDDDGTGSPMCEKAKQQRPEPGFTIGQCQSLHDALALVSFKPRDNVPGNAFAIYGNAEFDCIAFETASYNVNVRVIWAKLEVKTAGCRIVPQSKYREVVQVGKYSQSQKSAQTSSAETSDSAHFNVSGGAGSKSPIAKMGAALGWGAMSRSEDKDTQIMKRVPEIEIIQPIPVGFRIGIENAGDPVRDVSDRTLDGPYPKPDVVREKPLFSVEFEPRNDKASVDLTLYAPSAKALRIQTEPKPGTPKRLWGATETHEEEGRRVAVEEMKNRIAALMLLDNARKTSALDPEMAVPLATQRITAVRLPDAESSQTQPSKTTQSHDETIDNARAGGQSRKIAPDRKRAIPGVGRGRRIGPANKLPED